MYLPSILGEYYIMRMLTICPIRQTITKVINLRWMS
jgi:hypothetical protein